MDSPSARTTFGLILRILRVGNYKFARIIDLFLELPATHQDALVKFLQEEIGDSRWEVWANDRYLYLEYIKAVLMHYSGRESANQPTFDDLAKLIGEYIKSENFREAGETVSESDTFIDELEAM